MQTSDQKRSGIVGRTLLLGLLLWLAPVAGRAVIQFDVFIGYDSLVPEAAWFPITFEVRNDGPTFTGTVEVAPSSMGEGQRNRVTVELPTGTLKRFTIPVFSGTRAFNYSWDARLYDERGKLRAEQPGAPPRRRLAPGTTLLGALPRTAGGTPQIKAILANQPDLQPATARLLPALFPDNPLVLEGLETIYLNSEKASELSVNQVNALQAWLQAGGHLIVAVEQPSDISSSPWLKDLFPIDVKDLKPLQPHPELQEWLKTAEWRPDPKFGWRQGGGSQNPAREQRAGVTAENPFTDLPDDFAFETAPLQVATGTLKQGKPLVSSGGTPLIVSGHRGRGQVTALLFSPEREPVRSWKNLSVFWAKLADVPGIYYVNSDFGQQGGWSSDGVFGAMLDSRQVHKLPIEWLLLLLIVYLVVIGPLDYYWLKRINRPMLTWVTFPCYVLLFSGLIYFIGYKLRAGESEWNELHVVDVLAKGERAELRGRTYSSVYSPANERYLLESPHECAAFRGEFVGMWGGQQGGEKATIQQKGDSFAAEIFVPVWSSQLYASDWWESGAAPLTVQAAPDGTSWRVTVENRTDKKFRQVQFAIDGNIMSLGEVPPGQTRTFTASPGQQQELRAYVMQYASPFQHAASSRQRAFGQTASGRLDDLLNSTVALSFLSAANQPNNQPYAFITPPGLDLVHLLDRGQAVVLAWADDYSPAARMYKFSPRRSARQTLWRVAVPVQPSANQ